MTSPPRRGRPEELERPRRRPGPTVVLPDPVRGRPPRADVTVLGARRPWPSGARQAADDVGGCWPPSGAERRPGTSRRPGAGAGRGAVPERAVTGAGSLGRWGGPGLVAGAAPPGSPRRPRPPTKPGHGQVVGHGDGVDHGHRRRRAVADHAHAVHPEQHGPAGVLGIEGGGQREEVRVRGRRRPPRTSGRPRISVRAPMRNRIDPSRVLRATLPVKPSVTMTSAGPSKKSRPSTLPTKSKPGPPAPVGQQGVGLLHQRGALRLLLADGQQGDPGLARPRSACGRRPPPSGRTAPASGGVHSALAPESSSTVGHGRSRSGIGRGDGRPDHPGQPAHPQAGRRPWSPRCCRPTPWPWPRRPAPPRPPGPARSPSSAARPGPGRRPCR